VAAGNNLNLNSVQTVDSINATWNAQNYSRYGTQSEVGTQISGAGAVQLSAANDLTARAANVQATGALSASAGNDLNIVAGQTTQSLAQGYHAEGSGLLQSASVTSRTSLVSTQAEASNFGGNTVNLQAGHDINVVGSNVVGDNAVNLNAQNNLNIVAAVNTMQQSSFKEETKSGLMGSGGIGITIGSQKHSLDQQVDSTGVAASTIGSTQGNVTLNAGEIYQQTGSDVLAPAGDVSIAAKQINIVAGVGTSRTESEDHFEQSGLTLAVTGAAVSALQGVQQMAQAASKTKSTRMKALAAASAGMGVANGVAAQAAANAKGSSGIGLSITVGGSQSDSNSVQQSTSLRGSQVSAGGNVSLNASGDSQTSDITVIASNIKAGQETSLSAEHDINLLGGESVDEQRSKHSSLSYGAGLAIEFNTSGGAAFGFTANAAGSRGNSDGRDVAQIQSQISGDQKVTLVSGNDTTLRSAVVSGKQVSADVGNNLNIVSVQDTSSYASKDQSLSGSMTVGFGFSGSLNASMGRVNADFASVAQQSGIAAGDGGFQLVVNGNTDLQGGKISSTQAAIDSNSNSLTTGSLTASNIDNKSQYKAESISIGTGGQGTSGGIGYSAGSQQSTTYSSISGGQINIDEAAQQAKTGQSASEALAAVDRSGLTGKDSSNSLIKDWNGQELQADVTAQAQIMQAFGQQAAKAIGDYAGNKSESLKTEAKAAMLNGDTARAEQLTAEAANWDEGGAYRVALHAATGALGGGVGGALGAAVSSAAMPEISKAINGMGLPDVVQKGLEQVVATALGAAVGGAAGAVSGVNVEANNRQLHPDEKTLAKKLAAQSNGKYTVEQIEDAMRASGNKELGESVATGSIVSVDGNKATVYDDGAKWSVVGENGVRQLVQQVPLNVSADLVAYIQKNTGDTYSWSPVQNYSLSLNNSSGVKNSYAKADCSGTQCTVVAAPPTLPTRDQMADAAGFVSTQSGRIGSVAAAAGAIPGPHTPVSEATALAAGVVGLATSGIEQLLRPNVGSLGTDLFFSSIGEISNAIPGYGKLIAPVTNEAIETAKKSSWSIAFQDWINKVLKP
jgi:filamentous hemagglutinin